MMDLLRRQWLPVGVLVAAVGLLAASLAWVGGAGWGPTGVGPSHMMGGAWVAGDGPVRNLDDAQRAAARFADRWGLTVAEVMQFDNGFYAELATSSGTPATEVLIDPDTGDVQIEYGPAMMWNAAYGMHPRAYGMHPRAYGMHPRAYGMHHRAYGTHSGVAGQTLSAEQAVAIANEWLETYRPGEHADDVAAFPGYYTLHTLRGDQVVGMVSVNAVTGAVWPHTWHGRFIAMSD